MSEKVSPTMPATAGTWVTLEIHFGRKPSRANSTSVSSATADLSVVNVAAALAGRPAVLGIIPAGMFPREMALEPGGQTLLVTNYASGQLEAISVPTLPAS